MEGWCKALEKIKYHPLVDADTDGTVKVPMFCSTDGETIKKVHSLYLREIVPDYFSLFSNKADNKRASGQFEIHCPTCGKKLRQIGGPIDQNKLGLYVCDHCRADRKN